ncbi:hypothetical protein EDB89DRAFT_1905516 [Lactarius sanguifluus]|nr:hypothetical protein EDB89DRAFT_1905516 [Lactarius sanguifluus]
MYRKYANNVLVVLLSALSVASIILTHALFAFVKNVQFETVVMKEDYKREVEMVVEESVHYAGGVPGRRTSGGTKEDSASTARDASAPTTGRSRSRSTTKGPVRSTCTGSSRTAPASTDSRTISTV